MPKVLCGNYNVPICLALVYCYHHLQNFSWQIELVNVGSHASVMLTEIISMIGVLLLGEFCFAANC